MKHQVIIGVVVICISLHVAHSCFCQNTGGPPKVACDSDYVIKALVNNQKMSTENGEEFVSHDLKVIKIFKANDKAKSLLKEGQTFTIKKGVRKCKPFFMNNKDHVVTGYVSDGKLDVKGCGGTRPWDQLNDKEITGYTSYYYTNCTAPVATTPRAPSRDPTRVPIRDHTHAPSRGSDKEKGSH